MISGASDDEWIVLGEQESQRDEPSLALALRPDPCQPIVQHQSSGEVYELILGPGQSYCKQCGKPKGYIELKLHHIHPEPQTATIRTPSKWCLAACCVDCHKWILVESYGGEGVDTLHSKGWTKTLRYWRCPTHSGA